MATPRVKRRLAAVLALDAAGYSRLMSLDEEGTHRRLISALAELVEPLVEECDGRVVKRTGDGVLAEFASVVEAMRCALGIQLGMRGRNVDVPPELQLQFRIGLNVGDVIVEPDEIYGEGVNIAVRLEGIAEPGTIFVSQTVAEQVGDKLDATFVDKGEHVLKNIAKPVRVYAAFPGKSEEAPRAKASLGRVPGFGDRPAIAVLPFANLSGEAEQEYFADGITQDIISLLAAWRALPVIARNSAFAYKGRNVDLRDVGRELGVRYVVEGSVRRQGSRVRITAQLVDTETNQYCFADRYDREVSNLFAVQDEIVANIVGEIEPELLRLERERAARSPQERMSAYDELQRGLWHHYRYTAEDNREAQRCFRRAMELDGKWSEPIAALAIARIYAMMMGWEEKSDESLAEILDEAKRAVACDARDPQAQFALALAFFHSSEIAAATAGMREVIRLNPSHAAAHANLGSLLNYDNQPEPGLQSVLTAFRLSPNDPRRFIWIPALAGSYYGSRRYEEAVENGRRGLALKPDYLPALRYVVAALGQLGRRAEAASLLPLLRTLDPSLADAERYLGRYYVARPALDHILDGLRKAGFE